MASSFSKGNIRLCSSQFQVRPLRYMHCRKIYTYMYGLFKEEMQYGLRLKRIDVMLDVEKIKV